MGHEKTELVATGGKPLGKVQSLAGTAAFI